MTPEACLISILRPNNSHEQGTTNVPEKLSGNPGVSFTHSEMMIGNTNLSARCGANELLVKGNMRNAKVSEEEPAVCGRCSRTIFMRTAKQ